MERDDSFQNLYDQIDANADEELTDRKAALKSKPPAERGRRSQSLERGAPRGKSQTRSKSKSRARSKSRSRRPMASESSTASNEKPLSARDLFADSPTKSEGDRQRPRMGKSNSMRELMSNANIELSAGGSSHEPSRSSFGGGHHGGGGGGEADSEKIEQLEVKNALYKEEFKRVQKEKKQLKKAKDAEIEELQAEIDELRQEVRVSDAENRKLKTSLAEGAGSTYKLKTLEEENARLQAELKETVDRASSMVKEREKAIDDLLQELETVKSESIQSRTMFDATLYKNKLALERLDQENDDLKQKISELEAMNGRK